MQDQISEIVGKEAFDQVERLVDLLFKATQKLEDFIKTGRKVADEMSNAKGFYQTSQACEQVAIEMEKATKATNDHKIASSALKIALKDYMPEVELNIRQTILYKKQLEDLKNEKKELDKEFTNKDIETYRNRMTALVKSEQQLKVASSELSQTIKAQIKEVHAVEGSYDALNQRLGQLRNLYRQISESDRAGDVGQTLLGEITQLDTKLKAIDASIGNFQRNVGNYASGFSNFSDAFKILQSELDATRTKINQLSSSEKQNIEVLKQLQKEEALLSRLVDDQVVGFASATQELKKNEQALQSLAAAGLKNTAFYEELLQQTAELKDSVGDLKAEIKNLGSDTSTIEGLIEGTGMLAGGFAVAEGAAALFGNESEELQKTMVKLQAIMSVVMGLQQIQNALQKESSFMLLINSARTKALAAAQTIYSYATGGATVATNAFRTALIGTGLGAFLVLLSSAAAAMTTFGEETRSTNIDIKNQEEALRDLQEEYDKLYDRDKRLYELGQLKGFQKGKSMEDLKRELTLEEAQGTNLSKIFSLKNQILDKELLELDIKKKGYIEEGISGLALAEVENDIKNKQNERTKLQIENSKKIADLNKSSIDKQTKDAEDAAKKQREVDDRNLKARYDLIKAQSEAGAEEWKAIADDEKKSQDERLQALANYTLEKENIIRANADYEALTGNKTKDEILLIEAQKAIEINRIHSESARASLAILKQQADEEAAQRIETLEKITLNTANQERDEIAALNQKLAEKKLAITEYESEVASIKDKYAKKGLQDTIDYLQKEIDSGKVQGDEKIELQSRLDEARNRSADITNQKIAESAKKASDLYKQAAQELISAFKSIVNSSFDKKSKEFDRNIENIEREKEAELNKIDQVAKNEDEARKLKAAAEAKYNAARIKEENDKRALQRRQAIFNKAADIANIATRTSLGVVTTLSDNTIVPGYLRVPMAIAVGAIGAAQLATAIATPIPQYYKGVESSPETWAWIGEKGTEGRINPDGSFELTPDKPTLSYLKKGTKIIPNEDLMAMALTFSANTSTASPSSDIMKLRQMFNETSEHSTRQIVRAIREEKQTNVNVKITSNSSWEEYVYKYYKK